MASKKQGGNQALVIVLVFFILATIGLGVATYFGFAEQGQLAKDKKKAEDDLKKMKDDRDWNKFQAHLYRAYMGQPAKDSALEDLATKKKDLDDGKLAFAQKDELPDVKAFIDNTLDKQLPWNLTGWTRVGAPPAVPSYKALVDARDARITALEKANDELAKGKEEALVDKGAEVKKVEAAETSMKTSLATRNADIDKDEKKRREDLAAAQKKADEMGDLYAKEKEKTAKVEAELVKVKKERDAKVTELAAATKESKELKDTLDESKNRLMAVLEKTGTDPRAVEAETLDAKATAALKTWRNDWQIVRRAGVTQAYINLGSADGLVPQLTFSVHALGSDGKLSSTPKGAVEVLRVTGPRLALARITSEKEPGRNPITAKDRLFHPTWDPSVKRSVAVAGIVDLSGDGKDSTAEFLRMLEKQGTKVDAVVDLKDLSVKGKVTRKTSFLILGEGAEGLTGDARGRDKDFTGKLEKAITKLKSDAAAAGVTVVPAAKYLDMIGYRPLRITGESGSGLRPGR